MCVLSFVWRFSSKAAVWCGSGRERSGYHRLGELWVSLHRFGSCIWAGYCSCTFLPLSLRQLTWSNCWCFSNTDIVSLYQLWRNNINSNTCGMKVIDAVFRLERIFLVKLYVNVEPWTIFILKCPGELCCVRNRILSMGKTVR